MKKPLRVIVIIISSIIVLLMLAAGFSLIYNKNNDGESNSDISTPEDGAKPTGKIVEITIHETGFEPASATIKVGDAVSWRSKDEDDPHIIASDPHPAHNNLPELLSPKITVDNAYSYTFTKKGTYFYHDDFNPSLNGTIVVK